MMKIFHLLLFCLWQPYHAVVGYTMSRAGMKPAPMLVPYNGGRDVARRFMDYDMMQGPGFDPFPPMPRRGDVPYWGYDQGIPMTRYSDFNDFRRGPPMAWGPAAPMGAFGPFRGGGAGGMFDPHLEEIKRRPNLSNREVQELFFLWNNALASLNPDAVARRYSRNSVLLATVSDIPRTTYDAIRDYFVEFLKKKPQGTILKSHVTQGVGWCMDAGIYEFVMGSSGERVTARYTFLYTYEDGEWKISHHHSSTMPEKSSGKTPVRARWLGDGVMMQV